MHRPARHQHERRLEPNATAHSAQIGAVDRLPDEPTIVTALDRHREMRARHGHVGERRGSVHRCHADERTSPTVVGRDGSAPCAGTASVWTRTACDCYAARRWAGGTNVPPAASASAMCRGRLGVREDLEHAEGVGATLDVTEILAFRVSTRPSASPSTKPPDPHPHAESGGDVRQAAQRETRGWRWRESNPRPLPRNQGFSGCSALWIFSAPGLARTRSLTGPVEWESRVIPRAQITQQVI